MRLVEHDDDLIPKRESIPTSPINDIKTDEKFYRVLAEVVSKKLEHTVVELNIKDATGEIVYDTFALNTYQRVKVGDKIDLIGECSLMDDDRIFFHSVRDIDTIRIGK